MENLRCILGDIFGEVLRFEDVAPGVYFFVICGNGQGFAREYYLVEQANTIISAIAQSYGKPIEGHPGLLVYEAEASDSSYRIIQYEVALYQNKCHSTSETLSELRCVAIYGMESYPEYFGEFPAPIDTPRGRTLRSKRIWNGVWCLETDWGEQMVAFCYPIWEGDISENTQKLGEQTRQDQEQGIENTYGYLFFSLEASCIPLFELINSNFQYQKNEMINLVALKNFIWDKYPEYALMNNLKSQKIKQELIENNVDISSFPDGMIEYSPDSGHKFLKF